MNSSVQSLCEQLVRARDTIKGIAKWDSALLYPACANLFCVSGRTPDENALISARDMIKSNTGFFSAFRGNVRLPIVCLLSMEQAPEERLRRTLDSYRVLKSRFFSSDYLALAAWFLSDEDGSETERVALRARTMYDRMKKEHPFLTGSEDSVFSVLLARSERDDDVLIGDMEESYAILKGHFRDSNSIQSVSQCLALDPRAPKEKASRVTELYDALLVRGIKYSRYGELSVLASLALADADIGTLAEETREADEALSAEKGWHGFFSYSRRTRAMHAVMLAADLHTPSDRAGQTALSSALSSVLAQQAMMCACVAATSAVSAASSSH